MPAIAAAAPLVNSEEHIFRRRLAEIRHLQTEADRHGQAAKRFLKRARHARDDGWPARAAWLLGDALEARARQKYSLHMAKLVATRMVREHFADIAQAEARKCASS